MPSYLDLPPNTIAEFKRQQLRKAFTQKWSTAIPERFRDKSDLDFTSLSKTSQNYLAKWKSSPKGLVVFFGAPNGLASKLAALLLKELLDKDISQTFTYTQFINLNHVDLNDLKTVDFLLIDGLSADKFAVSLTAKLSQVLEHRYAHQKITLLTSFFDTRKASCSEIFGDDLKFRLSDTALVIPVITNA